MSTSTNPSSRFRTADVDAVLQRASDAMTARRVYGEPIERDGTTVIPVARVGGGGGGGGGEGPAEEGGGSGVGFGIGARPVGAFVIRGGDVRWQPAIDVNQLIGWVGMTTIAVLLTRWRIVKARTRLARKR